MESAAYLAVGPMDKVPAIRRGGAVVTEAAAICACLAAAPAPAARHPRSPHASGHRPLATSQSAGVPPATGRRPVDALPPTARHHPTTRIRPLATGIPPPAGVPMR